MKSYILMFSSVTYGMDVTFFTHTRGICPQNKIEVSWLSDCMLKTNLCYLSSFKIEQGSRYTLYDNSTLLLLQIIQINKAQLFFIGFAQITSLTGGE